MERLKSKRLLKGSDIRGSIAHFKLHRWNSLNWRTVNGTSPSKRGRIFRDYISKGIELRMTRIEFYTWCDEQWPLIKKLYAEGEVPSIDRKDAAGHYSIGNLQIISLRENVNKGRRDHRHKIEAAIALRVQGLSCAAIARKLHISAPTICRWFRDLNSRGRVFKGESNEKGSKESSEVASGN